MIQAHELDPAIYKIIVEDFCRAIENEKNCLNHARADSHYMRGIDYYSMTDALSLIYNKSLERVIKEGRIFPLSSPRTFNEHLFRRFFFAPHRMPSLADKLLARDYVLGLTGPDHATEVAWVGTDLVDLFSARIEPGRYLLKASHGCGQYLALNVPADLENHADQIRAIAQPWMSHKHGVELGEWHYATITPRLFLEKFLDMNDGEALARDYKLYCFNGKVKSISVISGRSHGQGQRPLWSMYTPQWRRFDFDRLDFRRHEPDLERPQNLDALIAFAETVSAAFDFVSVDLYSDGADRIVLGELTFTPSAAQAPFSTPDADLQLGAFFAALA